DNCFIAEGCEVKGIVVNSILSTGCTVEENAVVENSVIMPNTVIGRNAIIKYAIIGEECHIFPNAKVGDDPKFYEASEWGISVVGKGKTIQQNALIEPGKII
ncbi:MAG TPA: glucose-1-phosphate adenylyltransferase, partial [Clostridiales bacterium]|nr:glucose-1-phosphate adenylyltransferase [Clostridiales bacterium]